MYEAFEVDFKDVFEYMKNMLSVSWLNAKEMDYIQEAHYDYVQKFDKKEWLRSEENGK